MKSTHKHLLVIAYHFPPSNESGNYRPYRFTKYLQLYGWVPIVLTVSSKDIENIDEKSFDRSLYNISIFRTPLIRPYKTLLKISKKLLKKLGYEKKSGKSDVISNNKKNKSLLAKIDITIQSIIEFPDKYSGWLLTSVFAGIKICSKHKPKAILSTGPPWTNFIVGTILSKIFSIPLLVDYRDPWTDNPWVNSDIDSAFIVKIHELTEKQILKSANVVICVSNTLQGQLRNKLNNSKRAKFIIIPNGFDPDDYSDISNGNLNNKLVLAHIGTVYGNRNPYPLLRAVRLLIDENKISEKFIEIFFIGKDINSSLDFIDKLNLQNVVRKIKTLPHKECLNRLNSANVAILLQDSIYPTVPGKAYEYLALKKPILAVCNNNLEIQKLLSSTKIGLYIGNDSVEDISDAILFAYKNFKKKENWSFSEHEIEKYNSKKQTAVLADLLNSLNK